MKKLSRTKKSRTQNLVVRAVSCRAEQDDLGNFSDLSSGIRYYEKNENLLF